VKSYLFR